MLHRMEGVQHIVASPCFVWAALTLAQWLWLAGGLVALWMIVSAMGRRRVRLTELLRDHVKNTQPDPEENAPDNPDSSE